MVRAAAALLTLALTACALDPRHASAPSAAERGHVAARQICAACHEVEPNRTAPRGAAPAFASREMQHMAGLEGRVATLTREGHYAMPPQNLTAQQVSDLVAYIEGLKPPREKTLDERPREVRVRPQG